jgi:hypothetical protein
MRATEIKSAFPRMVPKIVPISSAPAALKPEAPKDVKSAPSKREPEPLPQAVELWLEIITRSDRQVFGWCYLADRPLGKKAIVIVLNRHHRLVEKSLKDGEGRTLALLISLSLSEFLLCRQKRIACVGAALKRLREALLPGHTVVGCQLLAEAIADSSPFKRIAPGGAEPGTKILIATVHLEDPPTNME